jgi:hypothetical protein
MSQANLELVRRNNDAYNARDLTAYLDTVAESVRFESRVQIEAFPTQAEALAAVGL